VVQRRLAIAVGLVVAGFAVAWRPAVTLLADPGFEFVGPGAAVPGLAVLIGAVMLARGFQLLGRLADDE
jgi:hypothetical protein